MVGDPELGTLPGEFRLAPAPGLGKMKHVKARVISPDEPIEGNAQSMPVFP